MSVKAFNNTLKPKEIFHQNEVAKDKNSSYIPLPDLRWAAKGSFPDPPCVKMTCFAKR